MRCVAAAWLLLVAMVMLGAVQRCDSAQHQATAGVVHYASPHGSSHATGTLTDPLDTIAACVARLQAPGDMCRLRGGTYREPTVFVRGARGSPEAPVVIAAAEGEDVLIDGTVELPGNGTWTPVPGREIDGGKLWETNVPAATVGGGVTQLWLDGEMLTPARWPNALWSEVQSFGTRAPFNWSNWARFNSSSTWSPSNYTAGVPLRFVDAGGPTGLGSSGISAKGAVFIGNIAHDDTFVGTVTAHVAGSNEFMVLIKPSVQHMGNTKQSNSLYFFEGPTSLLDQAGEWSYSQAEQKLRVRTPHGTSPTQHRMTYKAQTYAMNVTDSPYLTLANLSFLGTTINAAGGIPHLLLDSLSFRFPSFTRRMLGELQSPSHMVVSAIGGPGASPSPSPSPGPTPSPSCTAAEDELCPDLAGEGDKCSACVMKNARQLEAAYCFDNHARHAFIKAWCDPSLNGKPVLASDSSFTFRNCSFFGADGISLTYQGSNGTFENNLWQSNDWSCHDVDTHTGAGCVLVNNAGSSGDHFTRNTMIGNGASVMYSCGVNATMTLNHCLGQADIDNDGVCLQIRSSSATGSTMAYNWAERSAKGLRLDSGSNTAFVPEEVDNSIYANVALMTNGMELKNDYNTYAQNLALWPPPHGAVRTGASAATAVFRVDTGRFKGENSHSVLQGNVASSWATPLAGVTNVKHPNVFDAKIGLQMRDPHNLDFRPRDGTRLAQSGAGPYASSVVTSVPEAEQHACVRSSGLGSYYWIPGRRDWWPSSPVPPDRSDNVAPDLDLMFLSGLNAARSNTSHIVWFGPTEAEMVQLAPPLGPGCNVQRLSRHTPLKSNSTWVWRVDEIPAFTDYNTAVAKRGAIWTFTVRTAK